MRALVLATITMFFATTAHAEIACPVPSDDHIIIATFNVYKFCSVDDKYLDEDETAATDEIPDRVKNLAIVIEAGNFDLVALQEVTSGERGLAVLTYLVTELETSHGLQYRSLLSDYISQGLMPEAIAFLYKSDRIKPELIPGV